MKLIKNDLRNGIYLPGLVFSGSLVGSCSGTASFSGSGSGNLNLNSDVMKIVPFAFSPNRILNIIENPYSVDCSFIPALAGSGSLVTFSAEGSLAGSFSAEGSFSGAAPFSGSGSV